MLYADDAGVVLQLLPEQLRKMIGVIVVVCAAFRLTVSEAKSKGIPEATVIFSEEAGDQIAQSNERTDQ